MNTKAIDILRSIAEDNTNTSHSNLSLAYQAAVKVALHELEKPLQETNALRRIVSEQVEAAINDSFANLLAAMDKRIGAIDERVTRVENVDEVDLSDIEERLDEVESKIESLENMEEVDLSDIEERLDELEASTDRDLVTRVDDVESRMDDYDRTSLEDRVGALENGDDHTKELDSLLSEIQAQDARMIVLEESAQGYDERSTHIFSWTIKTDARLEVLEVAQTLQKESVVSAVIDFIKGRLA